MTINYYQSSLRSADLAFFNLSSLRCKCVLEVSSSSTRACDSRSWKEHKIYSNDTKLKNMHTEH